MTSTERRVDHDARERIDQRRAVTDRALEKLRGVTTDGVGRAVVEVLEALRAEYAEYARANRHAIDAIGRRYHTFAARATAILTVLVLASLGFGFLSVYLLGQNSQRTRDIQASRVRVSRDNCNAQNARHDATIRRLDVGLLEQARLRPASARVPVLEAQVAALVRHRPREARDHAFTVGLIHALAPRLNCAAVVNRL